MHQFKKRVLAGVFAIIIMSILTSCGIKPTPDLQKAPRNHASNLVEVQTKGIDVKKIAKQVFNGDFQASIIEIEIKTPDYGMHFQNCYQLIPDEQKEGETFADTLIRLASQAANNDPSRIYKTLTIDLTDVQSDYAKWSNKDLTEYIQSISIQKEVEAFCLNLIQQTAPVIIIGQ